MHVQFTHLDYKKNITKSNQTLGLHFDFKTIFYHIVKLYNLMQLVEKIYTKAAQTLSQCSKTLK